MLPAAARAVEPAKTGPAALDQTPAPTAETAVLDRPGATDRMELSDSSGSETARTANKTDATQPERPVTRRQQTAKLKMHSPIAPKSNLAKGSDRSCTQHNRCRIERSSRRCILRRSVIPAVLRPENLPAPPNSSLGGSMPSNKVTRAAKVISSVRPVYPVVAKQSNAQGRVVVSVDIDASGKVSGARAISGPVLLRQAAIDSVKQWKYEPELVNGKPGASQMTVNIDFSLN